jgi:hypothetical protein
MQVMENVHASFEMETPIEGDASGYDPGQPELKVEFCSIIR